MLPKGNRIKKKKDFEAIFKNSKSFKNSLFIFRVAKNGLGINRVGFAISLKVSKKAVIRNKIRRRLSEIIRICMPNMAQGMDLVIIALPDSAGKDFGEIKSSAQDLLIKSGLIKK